MIDPITTRRWGYRSLFVLICMFLIFLKLMPLGTEPIPVSYYDPASGDLVTQKGSAWSLPGPDLIFALMATWVVRRPRWAPIGLIFAVLLLTDLLFLRPVGLWAAIALVSLEFLRARAQGPGDALWLMEFALFSLVFSVATLVNAFAFQLFGLPTPSFTTLCLHVIMTVIFYPIMLVLTHHVFGVRHAKPTDLEALEGQV